MVKEFAKGFELMKALQLPESLYFDYSKLGIFLNPLPLRGTSHFTHNVSCLLAVEIVDIVHYRMLLNAGESYLNWGLTFLCHFFTAAEV